MTDTAERATDEEQRVNWQPEFGQRVRVSDEHGLRNGGYEGIVSWPGARASGVSFDPSIYAVGDSMPWTVSNWLLEPIDRADQRDQIRRYAELRTLADELICWYVLRDEYMKPVLAIEEWLALHPEDLRDE